MKYVGIVGADVPVSALIRCVATFGSVSGFVATKCIYDFVPAQVFGFNVFKTFVEVAIAVYIHGCFVQQIFRSIIQEIAVVDKSTEFVKHQLVVIF